MRAAVEAQSVGAAYRGGASLGTKPTGRKTPVTIAVHIQFTEVPRSGSYIYLTQTLAFITHELENRQHISLEKTKWRLDDERFASQNLFRLDLLQHVSENTMPVTPCTAFLRSTQLGVNGGVYNSCAPNLIAIVFISRDV